MDDEDAVVQHVSGYVIMTDVVLWIEGSMHYEETSVFCLGDGLLFFDDHDHRIQETVTAKRNKWLEKEKRKRGERAF